MADDATITLDITMLPDDISKTLEGEAFSYTPADSTEGWFYKLMAVTNSSVDLISKETFLKEVAAFSAINLPVFVLPVNDIPSISL